MIERTLTIRATPETWKKLERFLALFHYNCGHSGLFAMSFDGDGPERLVVDPAPPEELRVDVDRIGGCGDVEIAGETAYYARSLDRSRMEYRVRDGAIHRIRPGSDTWERLR